MPKQYTHIELHPSGRADPTKTRQLCEAPDCTNEIVQAEAHSAVVVTYALPVCVQCPEEQHFCCSASCLEAAVLHCLREHTGPVVASVVAQRAPVTAQGGAEDDPANPGDSDL